MADGPAVGLARLDALEAEAPGLLPLPRDARRPAAAAGRPSEAAASYRAALELVGTDVERRFLERRLAETAS